MRKLSGRLLYSAIFICIALLMDCKPDRGTMNMFNFTNPTLVSCSLEPDHHYYVTMPDQHDPERKIPLVIVIDPHGDGLMAMQKFRDALHGLPIIIAGSNKLRNNFGDFESSLKSMYNDLLSKYPVDPQHFIVAGFSGGARMAFYYGMKHAVHGTIMFGAGPGQQRSGFGNMQIYAVSGTRDFNFSEQYRTLFTEMQGNTSYVNDYFRGIHEWPPERYMREAVVYCLRDIEFPYSALTRDLSAEFLREADSLQQINDLFFAGKAREKAWFFADTGRQRELLSADIKAFEHQPDWIACQHQIESFLNLEDHIKRNYAAHLSNPDTTWWSKEISDLMFQISTCSNPAEKDYYYRIRGFLGIYLYSQINNLLQGRNSGGLMDRLIWIYEQVEPGSEDLVKFKVELAQLRV